MLAILVLLPILAFVAILLGAPARLPHPPALVPVFAHLGLALMLGLWIPPYLAAWFAQAARIVG